MQILIILFCMTVFCLIMRAEKTNRHSGQTSAHPHRDQDQIDRLKARISVLEDILLDRDRKFRDGI